MKYKENKVYVTLIGHPARKYEIPQIRVGTTVSLVKDSTNEADDEAIKVMLGSEAVGYVANSVYTVASGTFSAGRLYDKFHGSLTARIKFVKYDPGVIIAEIDKDELEC